jgi:hypothetical protein
MSNSHLTYLIEHAEDLVPVLYDHARKLAAREYRWREGKTLPLGKTPEDIVVDVCVSYVKGAGSEGKRVKGCRHFDPNKDLMLQLKGAVRSAMWALTDKSSAKNELTRTEKEDAEPIEFAPTDSTPAELTESADFAKAAVEAVKAHHKFKESKEIQDLFAAFESGITDVPDQARKLGKKREQIWQLRHLLRQIYSEVIDELNKD